MVFNGEKKIEKKILVVFILMNCSMCVCMIGECEETEQTQW